MIMVGLYIFMKLCMVGAVLNTLVGISDGLTQSIQMDTLIRHLGMNVINGRMVKDIVADLKDSGNN